MFFRSVWLGVFFLLLKCALIDNCWIVTTRCAADRLFGVQRSFAYRGICIVEIDGLIVYANPRAPVSNDGVDNNHDIHSDVNGKIDIVD